tara:strand:+ start:1808 stop:2743 length:936 start_codon:yes stop_codon:yes gene_type:complete
MKNINDIKISVWDYFDKQAKANHIFNSIKYQIDNNGFFSTGLIEKGENETYQVKIYTPELALILISKELPAVICHRDKDKQKKTLINGWDYLQTYVEGYKEGEKYFDAEFAVSPNTIYGANAEQYVRDIHLNYFHINHSGANEGWQFVKTNYPVIFTHKTIRKFGYYSGIVSKIEAMVKKYPELFETFDKCEHDLMKTETEQKPPTFANNFDKVKPVEIYEHFKAGLVEKGYLTEQELNEYLKTAFELKTIPETLFKIKDAPTKQKIIKIFYEFYKNIAGTPHRKQKSYSALLGNYFEGFNTENVSTNFSK